MDALYLLLLLLLYGVTHFLVRALTSLGDKP
jgi:hypothetical protein